MAPGEKWCRRCEETKPVDAFARNATAADGVQGQCRDCAAAAYRARREALGKVVRPPDVPEGHKFCRGCQQVLPLSEWAARATTKDGLAFRCKACITANDRAKHLSRSYGLTVEDLEQMLAAQGGVCAICRSAPAVHVDHDHATGGVRDLLCFCCNAALGQFDDDPDVLRRAADYLARWRAGAPPRPPMADIRDRLSRTSARSMIELYWQDKIAGGLSETGS